MQVPHYTKQAVNSQRRLSWDGDLTSRYNWVLIGEGRSNASKQQAFPLISLPQGRIARFRCVNQFLAVCLDNCLM